MNGRTRSCTKPRKLNEMELQMLQNELKSLKNQQQSMERYTGLLLKDKQIQQLELANRREKLRKLELHVRQLERGKTPVPEDVRQKLQQTRESTASFEHEFSQLESKIKLTQETMSRPMPLHRSSMTCSTNIKSCSKRCKNVNKSSTRAYWEEAPALYPYLIQR